MQLISSILTIIVSQLPEPPGLFLKNLFSWHEERLYVHRGADKYLALPISYFPICSTTKRIFLGWVKEVRTMKS
jgi:hypothetical protein